MSKISRQSLIFIIVTTGLASCVSMLGGIGIEFAEKELMVIVPLVIALPALNTMVGNYAAIIAAHAGNPAERNMSKKNLIMAIFKSTIFNIAGTTLLSLFLASRRGYLPTHGFIATFLIFVTLAVLSVVAVMFIITYALEKLLEKHKQNPDEVLIPVVTTITDVFMLGLIALAAKFIF